MTNSPIAEILHITWNCNTTLSCENYITHYAVIQKTPPPHILKTKQGAPGFVPLLFCVAFWDKFAQPGLAEKRYNVCKYIYPSRHDWMGVILFTSSAQGSRPMKTRSMCKRLSAFLLCAILLTGALPAMPLHPRNVCGETSCSHSGAIWSEEGRNSHHAGGKQQHLRSL